MARRNPRFFAIYSNKLWREAMKVSKERIQEIIKEELELAEQEKDIATKQQLAKKFLELSKLLPKAQGIDAAEAQLISIIVNKIIEASNSDNARQQLKILVKKLGVKL